MYLLRRVFFGFYVSFVLSFSVLGSLNQYFEFSCNSVLRFGKVLLMKLLLFHKGLFRCGFSVYRYNLKGFYEQIN